MERSRSLPKNGQLNPPLSKRPRKQGNEPVEHLYKNMMGVSSCNCLVGAENLDCFIVSRWSFINPTGPLNNLLQQPSENPVVFFCFQTTFLTEIAVATRKEMAIVINVEFVQFIITGWYLCLPPECNFECVFWRRWQDCRCFHHAFQGRGTGRVGRQRHARGDANHGRISLHLPFHQHQQVRRAMSTF